MIVAARHMQFDTEINYKHGYVVDVQNFWNVLNFWGYIW
jgi:hypothetical protein